MNPAEAATVLTYINQADPLVPLNDTTSGIWWEAIRRFETEQAIWCINDYYANTKPDWGGKIPPLTPAVLRSRITDQQERAVSKRRALEPPAKHTNPESFRAQNPGQWDALIIKGRDDRRTELAHRGIGLTQFQIDGDKPSDYRLPA